MTPTSFKCVHDLRYTAPVQRILFQLHGLRAKGVNAASISSFTSPEERKSVMRDLESAARGKTIRSVTHDRVFRSQNALSDCTRWSRTGPACTELYSLVSIYTYSLESYFARSCRMLLACVSDALNCIVLFSIVRDYTRWCHVLLAYIGQVRRHRHLHKSTVCSVLTAWEVSLLGYRRDGSSVNLCTIEYRMVYFLAPCQPLHPPPTADVCLFSVRTFAYVLC